MSQQQHRRSRGDHRLGWRRHVRRSRCSRRLLSLQKLLVLRQNHLKRELWHSFVICTSLYTCRHLDRLSVCTGAYMLQTR